MWLRLMSPGVISSFFLCSKPPRRKSNVSKDLHTVPGNEVCADCGGNKPKWARYVHTVHVTMDH